MDMASLLAHIFEKAPQLGDALYAAMGSVFEIPRQTSIAEAL